MPFQAPGHGVGAFALRGIKDPVGDRRARSRRSWTLLVIALLFTICVVVVGVLFPGGPGIVAACGFAIVAGMFQVLSVIVSLGKEINDELVRQQLANGQMLSFRLNEMRIVAENSFDSGTEDERRLALGILSARFTHLQDHATMSLYGWSSVRPDLLMGITEAEGHG